MASCRHTGYARLAPGYVLKSLMAMKVIVLSVAEKTLTGRKMAEGLSPQNRLNGLRKT